MSGAEQEVLRGVTGDEIRSLFVFNDPCRNDCNVGATITAIVTWFNRRITVSEDSFVYPQCNWPAEPCICLQRARRSPAPAKQERNTAGVTGRK